MDKPTFIIDGNNISDLEGFYNEIDRVLTKNINFKSGHNLDAFNDILSGGFGVFDHTENVKIVWIHFSHSRRKLGRELTSKLLNIISEHQHIEFETIN